MPFQTWVFFLATVLALMSTPGPSQLLMLSNSAAHGFRRSLATVAGDLTANTLQMLAAGLGLAAVLTSSGRALLVVKWLGVAYLTWLGLRMILRAQAAGVEAPESASASLRSLWLQGFVTSAANPKAVVFFAALFPQFISAELPFWPQFVALAATYVAIDGLFLSAYGAGAGWLASRFSGSSRATVEHVGGGFMLGAAVLLGLRTLRQPG